MSRLLTALLLLPALATAGPDAQNGKAINEVCATCHGEFGQGGKQGEYPRLAGLPAAYLERQLLRFRTRERPNLPMVQHTEQRELPDADVADISAYLAAVALPTRMPPIDEASYDPYERLLLAKRVFNVARAPGDTAAGERLYNRECRACHGARGLGRPDKAVPFLAGQYTEYLWRQTDLLLARERVHEEGSADGELLAAFSRAELADIYAYLSVVDD